MIGPPTPQPGERAPDLTKQQKDLLKTAREALNMVVGDGAVNLGKMELYNAIQELIGEIEKLLGY